MTGARLDRCPAPSDGCPEGSQALGCLGVPDRGFLIRRGQAAALPKVASSADFENRNVLWGSQVRSASWKEPRPCLVPSFPGAPQSTPGGQLPSGDTGPRAGNTCPGSKSAAGLGVLSCLHAPHGRLRGGDTCRAPAVDQPPAGQDDTDRRTGLGSEHRLGASGKAARSGWARPQTAQPRGCAGQAGYTKCACLAQVCVVGSQPE